MNQNKRYKKFLYKKLLRLRVNPLFNNNKFFKLKAITDKSLKNSKFKKKTIKKFIPIIKFKKIKWLKYINFLIKSNKFYKRFKPYTFYSYKISKFASSGNSFRRKFRNDLLAKKSFNYMYGNLLKKYLKSKMTQIYRSKKSTNLVQLCFEFFESRLDSVIYKSKFSYSIKNARQMLSHKHIRVNDRIEKNGSYILKPGDLITVDSKHINFIKKNFKKQFNEKPDFIAYPIPPNYLNINYNTLEIIFGDIQNFNFATSFNFKNDFHSVITNYFRH